MTSVSPNKILVGPLARRTPSTSRAVFHSTCTAVNRRERRALYRALQFARARAVGALRGRWDGAGLRIDGQAAVEPGRLLEQRGGFQELRLAAMTTDELQADRPTVLV